MLRIGGGCGGHADRFRCAGFRAGQMEYSSAYPADNFHSQNLEAFAKDVAQVTEGKLAITVYPNASLFPASAIRAPCGSGRYKSVRP